MGLDHVMLKVKDWQKAKRYYIAALKPLGYEPVADWGTGGGFGVPGDKIGYIFVKQGGLVVAEHATAEPLNLHTVVDTPHDCCIEEEPTRLHVALTAPTEQALREYYAVAVGNGGKDNGAPGPRDHVPNGLACFVIDLDDNNLECNYRA